MNKLAKLSYKSIPELVSGSSTQVVAVGCYKNEEKPYFITSLVEDPETSSGIPMTTTTARGFTLTETYRSGLAARRVLTSNQGFTLIELLVVVLIIGILAAVALPQYQMAVEKSRVAQILPMMKNIYDALALYKLEHGSYAEDGEGVTFDDLAIDLPSSWHKYSHTEFDNDLWYCFPNEERTGYVYCENKKHNYEITMYQPDDPYYPAKRICYNNSDEAFNDKLCRALGGKKIEEGVYEF